MSLKNPSETLDEKQQREFRERTKNISGDRLVAYQLEQLRLEVQTLSANIGKRASLIETELKTGLAAIALAVSDNNSAQILELAAKVQSVREKLKSSVDSQTKGD